MSISTMTFVAPNLACGEARGGRIPHSSRQCRARAPLHPPRCRAWSVPNLPRYARVGCRLCRAGCPKKTSGATDELLYCEPLTETEHGTESGHCTDWSGRHGPESHPQYV